MLLIDAIAAGVADVIASPAAAVVVAAVGSSLVAAIDGPAGSSNHLCNAVPFQMLTFLLLFTSMQTI